MCLPLAIHRPADVLAKGEHSGLEWMVMNNGSGTRCGYVRVPKGHPWHGLDLEDVPASVHGGITFAEPDLECDKGGNDDPQWVSKQENDNSREDN